MRRLLVIGLATLFFSGFRMDAAAPVEQAPPEHRVEAALQADVPAEVPAYYGDYRPNPTFTDDRRLRNPGEVWRDSRGEMEVLKATGEQKRVDGGAAELTVRETKILRYEPDAQPEFKFVKLFVEVRNTGDEPVRVEPVSEMVTDTGETVHWQEEIYGEGLGGMLAPGQVKAGNVGFILEDTDAQVLTLHAGAEGKAEIRF